MPPDTLLSSDYQHLIVEISVTVYVFLLGLPILVYQIFLPEDLRRMSKKSYTGNLSGQLILLTLLLLAIIFTAYPDNLLPFVDAQGDALTAVKNRVITFLFAALLGLTLYILFDHLFKAKGYRARIIGIVKKKILRAHRRHGTVDPAYFDDLEYLGIYSKAGTETRFMIEALEELLTHFKTNGTATDDNDRLITLIDILCVSVASSPDSGSRQNMVEVLTIYKSILMDLRRRSTEEHPLIYGNETRKIKDCTTTIATMALKKDFTDMMPLVLNVLTLIPGSSDKLFDIGLMALRARRYEIAANVLSEMMDVNNRDELSEINYLGLIAHFYEAGPTARQCAERSLEVNGESLSWEETLAGARRHHYRVCHFDTVDKLEALALQHAPARGEF